MYSTLGFNPFQYKKITRFGYHFDGGGPGYDCTFSAKVINGTITGTIRFPRYKCLDQHVFVKK